MPTASAFLSLKYYGGQKMTDADFTYLMIVVGAFSMFMLVLGYYMFSVEAKKHPSGKRQRRHQDL